MRIVSLALLLTVSLTGFAQAQLKQTPLNVAGTVEGVSGTEIYIIDANKKRYLCDTAQSRMIGNQNMQMPNPCTIEVSGTESPKSLVPGMVVQFQIVLENKKTPLSKVSAMSILSPSAETQYGIINSGPALEEEYEKRSNAEDCSILGIIKSAKSGHITVAYPNDKGKETSLRFDMADDAVIDIKANSVGAIRRGDTITAAGISWQPGIFLATSVKVQHTPAAEKEVARGPDRGKDRGKGKGDDKEAPSLPAGAEDRDAELKRALAAPSKAKVKLEVLKIN